MSEIWSLRLTSPDGQEVELQLDNFNLDAISPVYHNEEENILEPSLYRFYCITGVTRRST